MELSVTNTPSNSLAYTNRAYVSPRTFSIFSEQAAEAGIVLPSTTDLWLNLWIGDGFVLQASPHKAMTIENQVALNGKHRKLGQFTLNQAVAVRLYIPSAKATLESVEIGVDLLIKKEGAPPTTLDCEELAKAFKASYLNQVFVPGQDLAMDFSTPAGSAKLDLTVMKLGRASMGGDSASSAAAAGAEGSVGCVTVATSISWKKSPGAKSPIVFTGAGSAPARNDNLFKSDFDFESMGIGGLGSQFATIFRKAFASRIFPGLMKEMGMSHVRGMLLYGPPGCGKTLIARQIGKVLNAREPKIVNGPEVLDKFVGGSEQKIRDLFAEAEKEQAEMGDNSMLHIIIFDEMDAIMKKRGSSSDSTGVHDSVVNQLLSKIDGVDSLNNILIIGMTNRKDMIDEAILRPGRLEIQIEICLPDEAGRNQILTIHTAKMKKYGRISADCLDRLPEVAALAQNYTGAELEGLVRSAASFAFTRNVDAKNIKALDEKAVGVVYDDFVRALNETTPAFGNKDAEEIEGYCRNGVVVWGSRFEDYWRTLQKLFSQAKTSRWAHLMSVLSWGEGGSGKTAAAAKLCTDCGYPFVRMISADSMIGMSEAAKCAAIYKVFLDSYKSPLSVIFVDEIERIIEFSPVGPRFSNSVLQTLLVLLRKVPPTPDARLLVIVTTSVHSSLEVLVNDLDRCFTMSLEAPLLEYDDEVASFLAQSSRGLLSEADAKDVASVCPKPIGVKRLLVALELAREEKEGDEDSEGAGEGIISKAELITALQQI